VYTFPLMIIIGITGTLGAGKGTVVDYLVNKRSFKHYSVRNYLIEEIKKRNLEVNRDNMVIVANDLRKKFGSNYLALELYKDAKKVGKNSIIESLRTPDEILGLRNKGNFVLFAVDADQKKRYKRITERASESDKVTFEKFKKDEEREMQSNDPTKQNLSKCILMADFKFDNNGTIKKLYEEVEKTIEKII